MRLAEQNKERPRVVGQRDDGPEAEGRGAVREGKGSLETERCAPAGVGWEAREHEEREERQRHHRALPLIVVIYGLRCFQHSVVPPIPFSCLVASARGSGSGPARQ